MGVGAGGRLNPRAEKFCSGVLLDIVLILRAEGTTPPPNYQQVDATGVQYRRLNSLKKKRRLIQF
jgi:hypothetical protein